MALHPVGDNLKVKIDGDKYGFGPSKVGRETGIVVEVPEVLHYFGKHSLIIEKSFMAKKELGELLDYFKALVGKRIAWESLQDRGRHFKEGEDEFVFLKLSDILGVADDADDEVEMTDDARASGGSFAL